MSLSEVIRSATSRAGVIRVRNALNPLLWSCAVASPLSWIFAYAFRSDPVLEYALAAMGALPVVSLVIAYFYFMIRDPDRLQSEEFALRQRELSIIERKAGPPLSLEADAAEDAHSVESETSSRKGGTP